MKLRSLWTLAALAPVMVLAWSPTLGRKVESWEHDGRKREVVVVIPKAASSKKVPMVIGIHGYGGNGRGFERQTGFPALAEKEGFIFVAPSALENRRGWNVAFIKLGQQGVDDGKFIADLTDSLIKSLPVDPKRVFVAGHSNGAMLANEMGARFSTKYRAIACMAGIAGFQDGAMPKLPKPSRPVSVLHIHGRADSVVAYESASKALLHGMSAPDGAKWWAEALGLKSNPQTTKKDGVQTDRYLGKNVEVRLDSLDERGHEWPSFLQVDAKTRYDATTSIWSFFAAQR